MTEQEIISSIENIYKNTDLIYEMMLANFVNLSGIGFQTVILKQGSYVIRARYSKKRSSMQNLSEISYPKKEFVKGFSRLNRPNQNLFYASETVESCLAEMLPFWLSDFENKDMIKVTLSKWVTRKDIKVLIIPDIGNENVLNKKTISQLSAEELKFWNYISKKYKTSTKDDENIYEFTSAFSNALWLNAISQNIDVHGFIYTSVQSPKFMNIALSTHSIDDNILYPTDILELDFQRIGLNETGLPSYMETGNRKKGLVDMDKKTINWT